eukprot:TRINITY_DN8138_c0_g1_i3.p1 TRINITY_DN8138_c0_g1~~TRINITY_DN8138_c0_g1_i3.p1  ORF type:complete len:228 (+),score=37.31 TRINITY_DN8138_c0_g1_i3:44-685(+)
MEQAKHKVVQEDVTTTLTNEAVAETLLRAKAGCDSPVDRGPSMDSAADATREEILPVGTNSFGSIGHPEMCARPCIYYASGTCTNGDSCGFCHLPHDVRAAHLDKKGRERLRSMTLEQRAAMLLPVVRQKIVDLRLRHDCVRMVDYILSSHTRRSQVEMSVVGQINKGAYSKFSLRALLGMLKANTDEESLDLQDSLRRLSGLLRSSCAESTA